MLLAGSLACGGSNNPASLPSGAGGTTITLVPASAILSTGQTVGFTTVVTAAGGVIWSVQPPAAGTIDGQGLFTPSGSVGPCFAGINRRDRS